MWFNPLLILDLKELSHALCSDKNILCEGDREMKPTLSLHIYSPHKYPLGAYYVAGAVSEQNKHGPFLVKLLGWRGGSTKEIPLTM